MVVGAEDVVLSEKIEGIVGLCGGSGVELGSTGSSFWSGFSVSSGTVFGASDGSEIG